MKSPHLFMTLQRVWALEMIQFLCWLSYWISNSKWIRKPCNSNIWIISQYLKTKAPRTHHGHIGASICVIHHVHAPPFAWYEVLLLITYFDLCLTPHNCENVRPWVTSHTCFQYHIYILQSSVKLTKFMALPMWNLHSLLYVTVCYIMDLPCCAQRSCYTNSWFLFLGAHNRRLVSIMPLISGVHNTSQNEIGAPTLVAH